MGMVMTMATVSVLLKVNRQPVAVALQEAREKLESGSAKVILDFSGVERIEPSALNALQEVADLGDAKGVKLALRNVNVDIYKALKLLRLAARFSYVD
jgi:anti-anti-sigma regulatory factor